MESVIAAISMLSSALLRRKRMSIAKIVIKLVEIHVCIFAQSSSVVNYLINYVETFTILQPL